MYQPNYNRKERFQYGSRFEKLTQKDETKIGLCEGKEPPDCQAIIGGAGVGKTFSIRERVAEDSSFAKLTATTGIAAVNLGGDIKTVHSQLKFFDEDSIKRAYTKGFLHLEILKLLEAGYKYLGTDEMSMLGAVKLDHIVEAVCDVNNADFKQRKLGIILIGDFCQLPPINEPFAFKANSWKFFAPNLVRLNKVWRQDNQDFVNAINMLRAGNGNDAVLGLMDCGVKFIEEADSHFDGTTLISRNDRVDSYNMTRFRELTNALTIRCPVERKGIQMKEWDRYIPPEIIMKKGAYVMILANDVPNFSFVNGDCGTIESYDIEADTFNVRLVRTGKVVVIKRVNRKHFVDGAPDAKMQNSAYKPHLDYNEQKWIIGEISYHPLRLAYASTVHKSQGLSLDKVQIDIRDAFFGSPAMSYVAISRCRTPENLVIVGTPDELAKKVKIANEVRQWI